MSGVTQHTVRDDENEVRVDRWFKQHYPALGHGRLSKLLRTGQIRVDGARAKTGTRLAPGQVVRVPPLRPEELTADRPKQRPVSDTDAKAVRAMVIHQDDAVIVLNKPAGLAVQGGEGVARHVDDMLAALAKKGERPKLVHRLDRDTSGLLILGRTAPAARALSNAFRSKQAQKRYDAVVVGSPTLRQGRIDAALVKSCRGTGYIADNPHDEGAKSAITDYTTVDDAGGRAAWLALWPLTGRTHQLRIHCRAIGTPILGDGKYGGRAAFLPTADIAKQVHLHARQLTLPHPDGGVLDVSAPLAPHMVETFTYFGFDPDTPVVAPEV
ncbi:MAG: RluA family pseudouridine synthase [Pseudomonadota bacterium]